MGSAVADVDTKESGADAGTSGGDAASGESATKQTSQSDAAASGGEAGKTALTDAGKVAGEPEKPAADVTYDLKLPEHAVIDATALERTAAIARELGLSNDAAQKVIGALDSEAKAVVEATLAAHQPGGAAWTKQQQEWEAALKADQTLGATPDERQAAVQKGIAVIDRFAEKHPEHATQLKSYLDASGLGSHPDVVHFFAWLGKVAGEGGRIEPGAQGAHGAGRLPDTQVFFGKSDAAKQ